MLADSTQGNMTGPLLEGIAIDAESIVACQRLEVGVLPRTIALFSTLADGDGFLFPSFRL